MEAGSSGLPVTGRRLNNFNPESLSDRESASGSYSDGNSLGESLSGSGSSSGSGGSFLRVDAFDPHLLSSSPDWISHPRHLHSSLQPDIVSEPGVRQLGFTPTASALGHTNNSDAAHTDLRGTAVSSELFRGHSSPMGQTGGLRESSEMLLLDEALVEDNLNSRTFFQPLLVGDETQRKIALAKAISLLQRSADEDGEHRLVRAHVSTVVRLSIECPFPEVRSAFAELLGNCSSENIGVTIPDKLEGFSRFVDASNSSLPSLLESSNDPELVAKLCRMAFLQRGRASHLVQLLAWHPSYLELFYHLFDFLMHGPGPLPLSWRCYICIMAASRSKCRYIVEMQEKEFPDLGGDPTWLQGLEFAPKKIQSLATMNAILAHQPWRLRPDHISSLMRGVDAWSMSELVQALVLLANTHSLACLAHGCGLTPEVEVEQLWCVPDERDSWVRRTSEPDITRTLYDAEQRDDMEETEEDVFGIVDMDTGAVASDVADGSGSMDCAGANVPKVPSNDNSSGSGSDSFSDRVATPSEGSDGSASVDEDFFRKYIGGVEMEHEDFDTKSNLYLHASDYSWKEEAFALVSQYYTDAAPLLDELFRHIYALTYRTFYSDEDVNTEPLRVAVRQYVHLIQGIYHDDYNYQSLNVHLTRTVKTFIKKVACTPERVTVTEFGCLDINLTDQEKAHLTLLIVEAKKQAELVNGLHAISRYLAGG